MTKRGPSSRRWCRRATSTVRSADIEQSIAEDKEGLKATLRGNRFGLKPIVWIGIILSVFQQFVGINVIFYYSTTLWKAVGFTESNSLLITVITSVTNVAVTVVAILLVDRVGPSPHPAHRVGSAWPSRSV